MGSLQISMGSHGVSMGPYGVSMGLCESLWVSAGPYSPPWDPYGFLGSLWGPYVPPRAPHPTLLPPRQGAEERLLSDLQSARRMGAPYGLKLVRGAYLHHERRTGALQPSREHTDRR